MCNCRKGIKRSAPAPQLDLTQPHQQPPGRKKRPRRVRFATDDGEAPPALLPGMLRSAPQPRHPFVATDQWLQPSEQKRQRLEALREASRMGKDEQSEHFRESYQGIYQICHALAANSTSSHSDSDSDICESSDDCCDSTSPVLPKQVGVACTQLLSHSRHEQARGLEDGLVPAVAVARRLERRRAIRTVVALQKRCGGGGGGEVASIAAQLSAAHGKFAHALALGDAAAAMRVYSGTSEQES